MRVFSKTFRRLLRNESGAAAIEYALIATLIGVAIIGGATAIGSSVSSVFNDVANRL
jgi:pilus assembly protein Flp/PilA